MRTKISWTLLEIDGVCLPSQIAEIRSLRRVEGEKGLEKSQLELFDDVCAAGHCYNIVGSEVKLSTERFLSARIREAFPGCKQELQARSNLVTPWPCEGNVLATSAKLELSVRLRDASSMSMVEYAYGDVIPTWFEGAGT